MTYRKTISGITLAIALILTLPAKGSQFSFDPSRGLVELEATVNGYLTGRFGIDTGADRLYLNREFAKRARIEVSDADKGRVVRGVDGSSAVGYATLRSFDIQGERIYNVPVDIIDLSSLTGGKWDAPDGLIGFSALSRYYVTVDYPQKRLDLYSQEILYSSDEVVGIPFVLQGHLIVVELSLDGSPPLRVFLDYCASMSIITNEALARIGRRFVSGEHQIAGKMTIVTDRVETDDAISSSNVTFLPRSLAEIGQSASFEGIDGILGYSFLASHKITVDYRRELLLFHR